MRRAARRDSNEPALIETFEACGATVARLNDADLPDLLIGFRGRTMLCEVKRPLGPKGGESGRALRPGQKRFAESWKGGPVHVVRTVEDVLGLIGAVLS